MIFALRECQTGGIELLADYELTSELRAIATILAKQKVEATVWNIAWTMLIV
jgi:hypothetical protein